MNDRRSEAGQTATEYLGIVVVVAAIIAGVMGTDLGGKVAGGLEAAICRITGGECTTGDGEDVANAGEVPIRNATTEGGGGSPQGPEFGDGEFPIADIPWTGAITLGDVPVGKGGLYVKASVTASETACTLGPDGKPVVNLNVAGNFKSGFAADGKTKGGASAGVDAYEGDGISWNIATNPDTAEDIQDGSLPTPTPVDPTTIPDGTTLTLTESTYKGLNLSAAYKGVQASMGYQKGEEVSSAVTRVDSDTVRVTVGDADFVEQAAGLSVLGVAKAGVTRRSTSAKAKQVDIDLSTKAGQQAYAAFVKDGSLPSEGTGVSGTTDIDSYTIKDALAAGIKLPGYDASIASNQVGSSTTVTHPDGSKTYSNYDGGQEITRTNTWEEDAEGNETQAPVSQIRYGNLSPNEAANLSWQFGDEQTGGEGDQDLTITLTEADIAKLQDAAKRAVANKEERGISDLALENLAEAAPGSVPGILQQTPTAVTDLMGSIRQDLIKPDERGDYTEEEFLDLLPDVEPSIAPAGC